MKYIVMRHADEDVLREYSSNGDLFEMLNPNSEDREAQCFQKNVSKIKQIVDGAEKVTISHSGVSRAKMTAELVAKGIGYKGDLTEDERLYDCISLRDGEGLEIIVSHLPAIMDCLGLDESPRHATPYLVKKDERGYLSVDKL